MGCTRLSVLPVLKNCLCDQFYGGIDNELGYHREFVRGLGEREWVRAKRSPSEHTQAVSMFARCGWGSIGTRCTRSGT
jgi:hypothetical protein